MAAPHPQPRSLHLRLQACGDEHSLAALLLTPRGMVPLPPIPLDPPEALGSLRTLLERWQRTLRFAYVIERPGAEPAAVQNTFQDLLAALDRFWRQPGWAPLHQALADNPGLPLCLEIPPPPGAKPQPRHPLALAEQLPWEHLPLNQRPIWRVRSAATSLLPRPVRTQWRRPRLLLIIGPSKDLDLNEQIKRLSSLDRTGRIFLRTLTGEQSRSDVALQGLRDPQGWDALIYLGHGEPSPEGGGGLRLERGMLAGAALADALRQAAPQLMLLSRCHGSDLVPLCLEAGVSWVWACRGEVSDPIAVAAFVALLEALEAGHNLPAATAIAGQAIDREFPGSSGMISLEGRADSPPLRLPLRRRRLWSQRLARSQRRQLVATGVALGLGLMAYGPRSGAGHPWGLPNTLLNFRLQAQKDWRDLRGVPPTPGDKDQTSPLVVWLLSSKVAYPEGKRVSREVLATVLRALPPERAPVVGIDVVLDDDGPQPVQPDATEALAALIQAQRRKVLFNITMHDNDNSQRPGAVGVASLPSRALLNAGLESFDGTLGIPENSFFSPGFPLQLIGAVGRNSFAGVLAWGGPAKADGEGLPAGSVIDWSIDWLAPSLIQIVPINPPLPPTAKFLPAGARVLVGVDRRGLAGEGASKGSAEPAADLYPVPDALKDQPSWKAFKVGRGSWLNSEGDMNHLPGPILQAVWAESLRRGHWLKPLAPLPTMALASGLGVLLAAGLERRRHHLLALTLISLLAVPVSLELALSLRVLVPLLFPLGALWASCLSRRERDG